MSTRLEISLFGGFAVAVDGRLVHTFESDKARALMAFMVTEPERPQRREKLAGLLWPDLTEPRARRNLSQTLYSLRKALGDTAEARSGSIKPIFLATVQEIQLNADGQTWLDVAAFRTGRLGCDRHTPTPIPACSTCLDRQSEAVALYRGDLLAGFSLPACPAFEEWLLIEREQLQRQALATFINLAITCRRRRDLVAALGHARRAVSLDPLWEPARREVMQALWLDGQRAEALAQYTACCEVLANELGLEPDDLTRKLARRIRADSEIISPGPAQRHNLPYPLTPFIGREQELSQVQACLADPACRLLTLLGPGGCGKSRLAVEAARPLVGDFPDGLFLLSLSDLSRRAALAPTLADILGVCSRADQDPLDQVLDFLRSKQLLLILDSCEGAPPAAELAVAILSEAPGVKIMATTRLRLNAAGETLFLLGGLTLPDGDQDPEALNCGAARLFLAAARRLRPDYEPDASALIDIVHICRLAAGMPLAIILAAAWIELLSPAKIAAAIAESLDFLAVEWPDLPERQRSLRSSLTYTWGLLEPDQQTVLQSLSHFRGGFSAAAAARVAGGTHQDLLALVNRALIQRTATDRFGVHDLMRQFAAEKLAAAPAQRLATERRHSSYFLTQAAGWVKDLQSERQGATLAEMDLESRNLASAWTWAIAEGDVTALAGALTGLGIYGEIRARFREGERGCRDAAQMATDRPEAIAFRVMAQIWQARFARLSGDPEAGKALLASTQALVSTLDPAAAAARAFLYLELGDAHLAADRQAALQWFEKSRSLYRAVGADWWAARAEARLAEGHHLLGRFNEALACYQQSRDTFANLGDPRAQAAAHIGLGNNCFRLGRMAEGEHHLQTAIDIFEALGDAGARATGLLNLARFSWWQGDFQKGFQFQRQALPIFRELGMRHDLGFAQCAAGFFLTHLGKYDEALAAAENAVTETERLGFPRWRGLARHVLGGALLALGRYAEARDWLQQAVVIFREIEQFEDLASALSLAGAAALHRDGIEPTRRHLHEALDLCLDTHGLWAALHALPVTALFLARSGQLAQAAAIATLAGRHPQVTHSHLFGDLAIRPVNTLAQTLPPDVVAAARERGSQLDLWPTVANLRDTLAANR